MISKTQNIRIAVQKNGRLRQSSLEFLTSLGLEFIMPENGELIVVCNNAPVELLLVRNSDIPAYVKNCVADFGIVGENVLFEQDQTNLAIEKLGFGKCSLVIAVPENSSIKKAEDLSGERIATSYPNSIKKFLATLNIPASLIVIEGSVEIATGLGLADAICDISQTGNTLRAHKLSPLVTVLASEAVLIASPVKRPEQLDFIKKFL